MVACRIPFVVSALLPPDNVVPVYTITGTGNPSPNGDYIADGTLNGEPAYKRTDNAFYIWYDDAQIRWIVSQARGIEGALGWYSESGIPYDGCEPYGTALNQINIASA